MVNQYTRSTYALSLLEWCLFNLPNDFFVFPYYLDIAPAYVQQTHKPTLGFFHHLGLRCRNAYDVWLNLPIQSLNHLSLRSFIRSWFSTPTYIIPLRTSHDNTLLREPANVASNIQVGPAIVRLVPGWLRNAWADHQSIDSLNERELLTPGFRYYNAVYVYTWVIGPEFQHARQRSEPANGRRP